MKPGIIICSHLKSSRVCAKALRPINGIPLIQHLLERSSRPYYIKNHDLPVILAVPSVLDYPQNLFDIKNVIGFQGWQDSPLERMYRAALHHGIDPIIRITHDKLFIERKIVEDALDVFKRDGIEYLYSSYLPDGVGFEIISFKKLKQAAEHFRGKNIEHISYAIKSLDPKKHNFKEFDSVYRDHKNKRLLLDYEDDFRLVDEIFAVNGDPSLSDVLGILDAHHFIRNINRLPEVSIYTCAYNEGRYIRNCFLSCINQTVFPNNAEYILVDDGSIDQTIDQIPMRYLKNYSFGNIFIKQNTTNMGLAYCSNLAADMARGKYIIRLDADDVFIYPDTVERMLEFIKEHDYDVVFPDYVDHRSGKIESGSSSWHQGGAIWNKKTLAAIRYDGYLRDYEGLEIMKRAKNLKVGHYQGCEFFYTNRQESLSNTNLERRAKVKQKIIDGTLN